MLRNAMVQSGALCCAVLCSSEPHFHLNAMHICSCHGVFCRDGLALSSQYALRRIATVLAQQLQQHARTNPPSGTQSTHGSKRRAAAAALAPAGPLEDEADQTPSMGSGLSRHGVQGEMGADRGSADGGGKGRDASVALGALFPTPCKRIDAVR